MKYIATLKNYLENNPQVKKTLQGTSLENVSPCILPAQYNHVKFESDRYVRDVCCKTVGEYKVACEKFHILW